MAPTLVPATARTWSAKCPTTSTVSRTPTASSAASMRASSGRPPTSSKHLWVRSVRGASRRATPAARMIAFTPGSAPIGGARRRPGSIVRELGLLDLHLPDELLVRRGLDDLVE